MRRRTESLSPGRWARARRAALAVAVGLLATCLAPWAAVPVRAQLVEPPRYATARLAPPEAALEPLFAPPPLTGPQFAPAGPSLPAPDETLPSIDPGPADAAGLLDDVQLPCGGDGERSVWVIDTRALCGPGFAPRVERLEGGCWRTSSLEDFYATDDPATVTLVYVHGNRNDVEDAHEQGLIVYRGLVRGLPRCVRLRYVIWSWPSDLVYKRPRPDSQVKTYRASQEMQYLAEFAALMRPDVPLSLMGYSFGARVVCGGLHLLAGGEADGYTLNLGAPVERLPARVMVLAAAMDNHWLRPGDLYGLALTQMERLVITVNRGDPVLLLYPSLWEYRGPHALGFTGAVGMEAWGPEARKVCEWNVRPFVDCHHALLDYLDHDIMFDRMRCELILAWQGRAGR